jgi:Fe(3+) dicitrate transport protein
MGTMWEFDDWVDVFASIHKGFSPVAPEQDESVLPEVAWNYEAGFRQHFDDTRTEFVLFANDYQRITGQCTQSSGCDISDLGRQFTGGRALIAGIETMVGVEYWLPNGMSIPIQLQYTFTHAVFRETFYSGFPQFGSVTIGDMLPYVARHQGSLSTGLDGSRGSLNGVLVYRGTMLDEAGTMANSQVIPNLLTLDVSANLEVTQEWQLYTTLNNATNVQSEVSWRPFGARPMTPRSIFLGVKRVL